MKHWIVGLAALVGLSLAGTGLAQVLVPEGLQPGETYHLFFVTDGTRDATSSDIADYNAFVQAEAERAGAVTENFGIDWFAVASTATVNARDNAPMEAPIYMLGPRWFGQDAFIGEPEEYFPCCPWPLNVTQFGEGIDDSEIVITGSSQSGHSVAGQALGDPTVAITFLSGCELGMCLSPQGGPGRPAEIPGHMYAVSEKLTVPAAGPPLQAGDADMDLDFDQLDLVHIPEPSSVLLAVLGFVGFLLVSQRRRTICVWLTVQVVPLLLSSAQATLVPGGHLGDGRTSLVYDANTGYIALDAPWNNFFGNGETIESAAGVLTGPRPFVLSRQPGTHTDFAVAVSSARCPQQSSSVPYLKSFGTVAQPGLTLEFLVDDLEVTGTLCDLALVSDVDVVYLPAGKPDVGTLGDDHTSIIYDATTGYLALDAPVGRLFGGSANIDSRAGVFTGPEPPILGFTFDNFTPENIFHGWHEGCPNFGLESYGPVAQPGLSKDFVSDDLAVVGSWCRGGGFGDVDLIYIPVPEPSALVLAVLGFGLLGLSRRHAGCHW